MGQEQTFSGQALMSAFGGKADVSLSPPDLFRFMPHVETARTC